MQYISVRVSVYLLLKKIYEFSLLCNGCFMPCYQLRHNSKEERIIQGWPWILKKQTKLEYRRSVHCSVQKRFTGSEPSPGNLKAPPPSLQWTKYPLEIVVYDNFPVTQYFNVSARTTTVGPLKHLFCKK